jgi:homoserine dehydrogenase
MRYNLAFIGFGSVGRALARLLLDRSHELQSERDITWRLTGVATRRLGWRVATEGFDVEALLESDRAALAAPAETDIASWLTATKAGVLFEMSSLNAHTGQPAIAHIEAALEHGAHAVTANKGPIVHGYRHLRDLAAARGKGFRFESAVMDGAPIFSLFRECLPLAHVTGFEGILNSTTNFLLEAMESGSGLEDAVRKAQAMGLAETDPAADVDGFDAAVKVAAIVSVIMDVPIGLQDVARRGIREIDATEVRAARAAGTPYKLMCRAVRAGDGVVATVAPERVAADSPFALVGGTSSVVHFHTDILPGLTITEHTPTPTTTAYGILADFIGLVSGSGRGI